MMDNFFIGAATALWIGIMTSISPCPLATNIAAISFLGRWVQSTQKVLLSAFLYTAGRTLAYLGLSIVILIGISSIPEISYFLQTSINKILGPVLIIVGVFLLEWITFPSFGLGFAEKLQEMAKKRAVLGAGVLGIVFALSFCPVSAALFFGSLLPLSVKHKSQVLFPALYGIGTALPVVFFALLVVFSAQSVGKAFNVLIKIERVARIITGVIFMLAGIYFCLVYIFNVL
jgi:cytochrome c biogenesis protein CcdA